jgi:CDP-diacylglycerol--serine O-phosphatidyltransferase
VRPADPGPARPRPRRFRRGAAILPSLFTTANLFAGFWAIVRALHGQFIEATWLIVAAIVLDMFDGRIARLTGTTSEFGGELDSLADSISFGVAPALLAYTWGLSLLPRAGWLAAFLFVMCGVLRLARFNVQRHAVDTRYFVGMPIPAAALQVAAVVHFWPEPLTLKSEAIVAMSVVIVLAFLMVSTFRYPSFKGVDLKARRSYITILPIAICIAVFFVMREYAILALATLYSVWAPTTYVLGLLFRRRGAPPQAPVAAGEAH